MFAGPITLPIDAGSCCRRGPSRTFFDRGAEAMDCSTLSYLDDPPMDGGLPRGLLDSDDESPGAPRTLEDMDSTDEGSAHGSSSAAEGSPVSTGISMEALRTEMLRATIGCSSSCLEPDAAGVPRMPAPRSSIAGATGLSSVPGLPANATMAFRTYLLPCQPAEVPPAPPLLAFPPPDSNGHCSWAAARCAASNAGGGPWVPSWTSPPPAMPAFHAAPPSHHVGAGPATGAAEWPAVVEPWRLPVPASAQENLMPPMPPDRPLKVFMLEYHCEVAPLDPMLPAKKRPPVW